MGLLSGATLQLAPGQSNRQTPTRSVRNSQVVGRNQHPPSGKQSACVHNHEANRPARITEIEVGRAADFAVRRQHAKTAQLSNTVEHDNRLLSPPGVPLLVSGLLDRDPGVYSQPPSLLSAGRRLWARTAAARGREIRTHRPRNRAGIVARIARQGQSFFVRRQGGSVRPPPGSRVGWRRGLATRTAALGESPKRP